MDRDFAMRINSLIIALVAAAVCGLCVAGCGKSKAPPGADTHSVEGITLRLHEQSRLFDDALARKDFAYIHDFGSYFIRMIQALDFELNETQKQQTRSQLSELIALAKQLDKAGGGRHPEATQATLQSIKGVLQDIDKQLRDAKPGG